MYVCVFGGKPRKKPTAESLKPEFRICCHKSAHAIKGALHRALPARQASESSRAKPAVQTRLGLGKRQAKPSQTALTPEPAMQLVKHRRKAPLSRAPKPAQSQTQIHSVLQAPNSPPS